MSADKKAEEQGRPSGSESGARPRGVRQAGGILDRIVDAKAKRVRQLESGRPTVRAVGAGQRYRTDTAHSFAGAISVPGRVNVIAEIKRRSPSKGVIREDFDPAWIAESYAEGGAAALSVLTEEDFFEGSIDYLRAIRAGLPGIPLLRKDFVFTDYQIYESAEAGADAVLLIAAVLEDELLAKLIDVADDVGLDALVEVHSEDEMDGALRCGASVIGINNRDLTDFSVDIETSVRLAPRALGSAILVSESGINTGQDISRLRRAGFKAFLVGEHLMRARVPGAALRSLIEAVECDT
jgi:indole-3-glycerol phosphate synthase